MLSPYTSVAIVIPQHLTCDRTNRWTITSGKWVKQVRGQQKSMLWPPRHYSVMIYSCIISCNIMRNPRKSGSGINGASLLGEHSDVQPYALYIHNAGRVHFDLVRAMFERRKSFIALALKLRRKRHRQVFQHSRLLQRKSECVDHV